MVKEEVNSIAGLLVSIVAMGRPNYDGMPRKVRDPLVGRNNLARGHVSQGPPSNGINGHRGTKKMTTRTSKAAAADEIAAIEDLMSDLEKRLRRLGGNTRREAAGASNEVGDFVKDSLSRIMSRVRDSAAEASHSAADEAVQFGTDALKKVTDEVEQRPLIMLAVAAGIGFLAGLANRR
jgi:ElaB/YqjD/DUF883 family membrane-anchored ribosome-binding protein